VQSTYGDAIAQGSTEFIVMAAREGVTSPEYVRFLAGWGRVRDQAIGLMEGTSGRQRVPGWAFDEIEVAVPPLDEQRRIAEVLRSVDEAVTATEAAINAAVLVRQCALDALMHDLVEAAEEELHVLSEVAEVRTGLAKNKNADGRHIRLPYLRVANVQDGWFDLSDMQEIDVEPEKVDRYSLKAGDVLLTEGGDYDKLGRGGVWRAQVDPCLHQNHVFCVRADPARLLPDFLALVTQSFLGRSYFLSCAKRTTNLASINSSQLKGLPLPVPDLEQQREIVAEIGCMGTLIENEEEKYQSLFRIRASLQSDLLSGRVRVPALAAPATSVLRVVQPAFKRAVLAAEIVHQLHKDARFGSVKHEKIVHLCELHAQLHQDPEKRNISEDRWLAALPWMRSNDLVPKGVGEKTRVVSS
jgi:type I restriction enzyme S subunit